MTLHHLIAACSLAGLSLTAVPAFSADAADVVDAYDAAAPASAPAPASDRQAGPTAGRASSGPATPLKGDELRGDVTVQHARARATVAGQSTGGAFMTLVNSGSDDKLLSARATVSRSVELHQMSMDGNVMHMRRVDAIAIKDGETVELKPGGYHVMFIGLNAPLKAGETFPLTLTFQKAREVTVDVKVEAAGSAAAPKQ